MTFYKGLFKFRLLTHKDVFVAGYKPAFFFVSENWQITNNHYSASLQLNDHEDAFITPENEKYIFMVII